MNNTVVLLKQFCQYDFVERDCAKTMAMLTKNVCWFGTSDHEDVHSREEARLYLEDEIRKMPTPYTVQYLEETLLPAGDGGGVAFLRARFSNGGVDLAIRMTATSCLEDGVERISSIHFSVADTSQQADEYFPVEQEKKSLVLSTMDGGLMGGYCEAGFPFYFINDRMLGYLGYEQEQDFVADIGGMISNVMHPDDRKSVERTVDEQLAKKERYTVNYRMRKRDGSYIWVHDIGKLSTDLKGRAVILSVCYDITAEHDKQAQIDNIVNAMPGGVALYRSVDGELQLIYQTDGVAALSGRSPEEYAQLISGNAMDSVHSEDRDKVILALHQALEGEQTVSADYRVPHKNGGYVWITANFRRTGMENGCPILHAVFTEMPQRQMLMTDITEHSGVHVVVTDEQTHELLYLNKAAMERAHSRSIDYTGRKCYEFLLGRSTPCDFCGRFNPLSTDTPEELYVSDLDCYYLAQGHTAMWAGHQARIEYLTDITREHREKQRLDDIINAIPGGVAIYKISDIFETVYFSDGVPALSGYTVEEYNQLIKRDAAQMTHPDDREMVVKTLKEAVARNTTADFIFRKIHRDGHTVWVHVQSTKIGEEDGCPLIQCVFHNISAQKEQELLNQHLLNSMAGGVIIYEAVDNATVHIVQHSKGIPELTGHTEAEYSRIASNGFDIVYEPERDQLRCALEQVLQTGEPVQTSHHIYHKDGHLVGVHMNACIIGSRNGHPLICAVFIKMSNESNMYQTIAQQSSDSIFVISKENHKLLYMNAQAKRAFHIDEKTDVTAKTCYELLRGCDTPCQDCHVLGMKGEGEPYEIYAAHWKRYLQGTTYSLDWAGIPAYVAYVSDITSRKAAAQEITNIYNNIPGAVFRCRFDPDWTVLSANDGLFRFLGYTREEFAAMGNRMTAVIYPEDLKIMTDVISAQLEEDKTTAENENRLICKDGTVKWISIKAQLLKDDQGERYFYCVFVDISSQKEAEQRRIASEKNLTVAVGHMSVYYWEIIDFETGLIHAPLFLQQSFGIKEFCADYPNRFLSMGFVAPEDCETYRMGVERIYQGQAYSQFDARIKTLEHGFVWMRLRITRIDEPGAKPRAVCTAEEIAEYKDLEQRVNTVMEQNSISSWRYDLRRQVLIPNLQGFWPQTWGGANREYKPAELASLLHKEDLQPWLDFHSKLKQGRSSASLHVRIRSEESKPYRHVLCHYTIMPDRDGVPTYALGSCTDITEQVHQKEKYESAIHDRYQALDKNVVLIGHCNITQDKLIELVDRTGMELQRRFGSARNDFFTGLGTLIPNEAERSAFYTATLSQPLSADFALGISHHSAVFLASMHADGHEPCWLSLNIDTVEQPESGDLLGFLCITDVTASKMQEQMLETVVHRSYDYIAHVNLLEDSMTLYRHREMQTEDSTYHMGQTYCLSAAMQYSAQQFIIPEERQDYLKKACLENLREKLQNKDSYEFAFYLIENGASRAKRMRIDILDRNAGTAVMTRSDVTEMLAQQEQQKKRLTEALEIAESANRHKTEFLSSMSHDIRTPMNAIIGMCALALQNEQDSVQVHESLQTIQSSSQILLELINNILDMSRIEAGKMVLHDMPFSLLEQIHKTADSYGALAKQKHQQFHLFTNVIHDVCRGDVSRIHSAIDNLLSNAIKYTPEGGTIIYRVAEIASKNPKIGLYRFEISDTGMGMNDETRQHIFEPFYRGEDQQIADIQGTGLGLPITKQIVELNGGTISVKSSPAIGSTFVIELPIHFSSEAVPPVPQSKVNPQDSYDFSGFHILLCEDHPVNQKVVSRILEKAHARVTLASNGKVGYETFVHSQPNTYQLILMDIRMPIMDGYQAAAAIRASAHPQAKTIPIIALSANAFTEDVQKSMQSGMNAHLAKPVIPKQIYQSVEAFCGKGQIKKDLKTKVLFVDDAEINIAVLTANLQDHYEVLVARDGTEALNTLEQNPDTAAIITDIMMPEMDGVTLIKTVRANERYNHIAILANTQYGGAQQERDLREIGADDFLYKPTTPDLVEKHLKDALQRHS
ncbi:MAG: PAS domain-containing protein [Eubacteriales bacterium]|nr:PAS domain-containing protein [Eubacteriales bacterium]